MVVLETSWFTLPLTTRARSRPTLPSLPKKTRLRYSLPVDTRRALRTMRWPPPVASLSLATRKRHVDVLDLDRRGSTAVAEAPFCSGRAGHCRRTLALELSSETEYVPPTAARPAG